MKRRPQQLAELRRHAHEKVGTNIADVPPEHHDCNIQKFILHYGTVIVHS